MRIKSILIVSLIILGCLAFYFIRSDREKAGEIITLKAENKTCMKNYVSLYEAKTKTDTVIRYVHIPFVRVVTKEVTIVDSVQVPGEVDTAAIVAAYGFDRLYADTLYKNDIDLFLKINVRGFLNYYDVAYNLKQPVITQQHIITEYVPTEIEKWHLYGTADYSLDKCLYAGAEVTTGKTLGPVGGFHYEYDLTRDQHKFGIKIKIR